MNLFILHTCLSLSIYLSVSLFIKCLKDYEISGFIEMNCDKLHIDLL